MARFLVSGCYVMGRTEECVQVFPSFQTLPFQTSLVVHLPLSNSKMLASMLISIGVIEQNK